MTSRTTDRHAQNSRWPSCLLMVAAWNTGLETLSLVSSREVECSGVGAGVEPLQSTMGFSSPVQSLFCWHQKAASPATQKESPFHHCEQGISLCPLQPLALRAIRLDTVPSPEQPSLIKPWLIIMQSASSFLRTVHGRPLPLQEGSASFFIVWCLHSLSFPSGLRGLRLKWITFFLLVLTLLSGLTKEREL